MSTSCQIATKTVPQGFPWTKPRFLCKLVIWGFGDSETAKWALSTFILEGAAAPLKQDLFFSSSKVPVLNFFPQSSWLQLKKFYHSFSAFKNWWNSFGERETPEDGNRPMYSFWLFSCWQFYCHLFPCCWWFLGCWSHFNYLLKKKVGRIFNILFPSSLMIGVGGEHCRNHKI